MNAWIDLDPVGKWKRVQKHPHRLIYEHPETGDRLVVIRLRGPGGGEDYENYVLRHVPADKGSWEELATVREMSSLAQGIREAMQRFSA